MATWVTPTEKNDGDKVTLGEFNQLANTNLNYLKGGLAGQTVIELDCILRAPGILLTDGILQHPGLAETGSEDAVPGGEVLMCELTTDQTDTWTVEVTGSVVSSYHYAGDAYYFDIRVGNLTQAPVGEHVENAHSALEGDGSGRSGYVPLWAAAKEAIATGTKISVYLVAGGAPVSGGSAGATCYLFARPTGAGV